MTGTSAGRIQRVDPHDGTVTDLYTECDGHPLRSPNDLVMDGHGGFWFTDHGIRDTTARTADLTGIYYAQADGSGIAEVVFPTDSPNGIGLSPDTDTLYWAETHNGRVHQRTITSPGEVLRAGSARLVGGAVRPARATSCSTRSPSTARAGCAWRRSSTAGSPRSRPTAARSSSMPPDDVLTTNICFGGDDLRTAYVTCSSSGRLVSFPWPRPGLRLAHQ